MKVYILSDMEGTAGVTIWDQVDSGHPKYQSARKWMTLEINAAAEGAFAAGATLVLVHDAHLAEHNLDLDLLDPRVEYIMGSGISSWAELDGSFDVLFQIGAHAKVGTAEANLRHTWDPNSWVDLQINGITLGEVGLIAAGAGDVGVPCVLVSGDDKACMEMVSLIPNVIQAPVKKGLGWQSARCLPLLAARDLIRERAKEACCSTGTVVPFQPAKGLIEIKVRTLAEKHETYYASSHEANDLLSEKLMEQSGTGTTVQKAFEAALKAVPRPL
ncbi:MAG: M55 family metallopeptidase [Phycisphaerae bacterium]